MTSERDSFLPPRWFLTVAGLAVLIWLIAELRELVVLLVIGYFLAYAIDPVLRYLERRGLSRPWGFSVVCVALVALSVVCGLTAVPALVEEFSKLTENLNSYIQSSREKLGPVIDRAKNLLPESLREHVDVEDLRGSIVGLASTVSGDTLKNVGRTVLSTLLQGYSQALTILNILLLPFIVFYIAVDLPRIHGFFRDLFPITKRSKVEHIFGEIDLYVSSFVRGQVIICTVLFGLYAIGLGLVGVDLWFLLAAIAGFGNMVPYVGTAVGIVLSVIMALVTFGDVAHVGLVLGVFAVVQFLEGMVITPRIMGESIGLSPLVIILSLLAGGQLFGLLGIFLAIPAAAALRVFGRHLFRWAREG
jgi:predicted PurR-regulated permease PerM